MRILYATIESNNVRFRHKASGMRLHLGERDAGQHFSLWKILHRMRQDASIRVVNAHEISSFLSRGERSETRSFRTTCSGMEGRERLLTIYYARILFFILLRTAFRYADFSNFSISLSWFHIWKNVVNVSKENASVWSTWHLIWWIVLWSVRNKLKHWRGRKIGKQASKI